MLNFQIALTSVPWDNAYLNTLRFDSRQQQEQYFNVSALFDNAPNVNLPIGTLLTTSIVVEQPGTIKLNPVMNYNYAIVRDNRVSADLKYYYYFVTQITQQSGNQIRLNIELDVMQTYYIDCTFEDCVINRAHLDRFVNKGATSVAFNLSYQSKLFNKEGQNVPKRCLTRQQILVDYSSVSDGFNGYFRTFQQNGNFWVYVFVDSTFARQKGLAAFTNGSDLQMPYAVLVAPSEAIYVKVGNSTLFQWSLDAINSFIAIEANASHILSYKVSPVAPFDYSDWSNYYDTSAGYFRLVADGASQVGEMEFMKVDAGTSKVWLANLMTQTDGGRGTMYAGYYEIQFEKSAIKGLRNKRFNPKLLGQNYSEIQLEDYAGNVFAYDVEKLNALDYTIRISENFAPDITKCKVYIEVNSYNNALGTPENLNKGYYGLVVSNDTQYPYTVTQLSTFLANNKNFALQQQAQRDYTTKSGLANAATGVAGSIGKVLDYGGIGSIISGVANAANTGYQTYIKNELSRKEESFTLDNAANAPDSVKNAQGNIFFNAMVNNIGFYFSQWQALDSDLQKIDDYMYKFGFSYERIDNIKNVDNIRHYFNFVQGDVENISNPSNISNSVHDKIRTIFRNGIRFWNVYDNVVTFDYAHENYERNLE